VRSAAEQSPGEALGRAEAVPPGVPRDVRLVDRDRGHAHPVRRRDRLGAEQERRRGVQHVRREVGDEALHERARQGDREPAVGDRRHLVHGEARVLAGRAGGRDDHHRLVTGVAQVMQHLPDGRRHPVQRGQEALGHDGDAHPLSIRVGMLER